MIVWTGFGLPILLLAGVVGFLVGWPFEYFITGRAGEIAHLFIGYLSGGVVCYFWGRHLNQKQAPRLLIDPKTQQKVYLAAPRHTVFWVNLEYIGIFLGVLGVFLAVVLAITPSNPS